jgi:hypothetical protein
MFGLSTILSAFELFRTSRTYYGIESTAVPLQPKSDFESRPAGFHPVQPLRPATHSPTGLWSAAMFGTIRPGCIGRQNR